MTTGVVVVFVVLSTVGCRFVDALECYSCNNTDSVNKCTSIVHCSSDEQCGGLSSVATSIVGRNIHTGTDLSLRQENRCFECCSTNLCNIHVCQYPQPSSCIDDVKADCAWMNSKFNICHNVHEAKSVCPRFCGLCAFVDGNWAAWSSWSGCDVTCANGSQTRTRQCTNPTPVNGGLECPGSTTESKLCSFPPCPVTPTVAFRSKDLTSLTIGSSSSELVFSTVIENIGNGYDSKTGKFTAPLPGTYLFSTQLCLPGSTSTGIHVNYAFFHNGSIIKRGTLAGASFYTCESLETYAILHVNDTVWIQHQSGSGNLYTDPGRWNMFSGVLVHI